MPAGPQARARGFHGIGDGKRQDARHAQAQERRQHNVACLIRQEEWKNRSIPQPEPVTRETDAEMQQDNQAAEVSSSAHTHSTGIGDSTVRPIARHMRDTEQLENANDDPESPGDWTPAKRIRLKSKPLVHSKRPRETATNLEHMENDELRRMGTGSTANKRKSDQPEEATVKEQRFDDIVMDQGPRDAGVTNMRMDEMPMDQVMAVSNGTSRVCVNEEKYELATIRGLPADLVKKNQAREMKDLDDMNVLEWVDESTVPKDAQILDCGWAMKMKSPSEVRARVVLKDYAVTKLDDLNAPTPTSMTVRCLLIYAGWFEMEVSTSDVRVALMHAVASERKFAKPPLEQRAAGWLWLIKKAMNGMRTASKDFGDQVANVMKEIQFELGKADHTDLQGHQIPSSNCIPR